MIITKNYAKKLVKQGKAKETGYIIGNTEDSKFMVVDRFDKQRTDHYLVIIK